MWLPDVEYNYASGKIEETDIKYIYLQNVKFWSFLLMIIGFIIGNVTEIYNEIGYEIKGRHK